jgi:hypothetical protein
MQYDKTIQSIVSTGLGLKVDDSEDFRQKLIERVRWVIDHQMARLPQYLYQLDVPEHRVNEAFAKAESAEQVPELLADVILERIAQVVARRTKKCDD